MPFNPDTPRSRDEVLLQAIVSGDSSMMGDPRDREEEFVKAIADKETLPDYSEASNGDVLQIGADGPEWGSVPNELPAIAAGDAGKVLKVNSGETGTEWGESGSVVYHHNIVLKKHFTTGGSSNLFDSTYFITIVNDRATPYTNFTDIKDYLNTKGTYPCSGWKVSFSNTSSDKYIKAIFFAQTLNTSTNTLTGLNMAFTSGNAPQTVTIQNSTFGSSDIETITDIVS